jgi:RNA-directed DNA polymerase
LNKVSLKTAFNAYFHNKYSFDDFYKLDIKSQYTEIFHSKRTVSPSKKLRDYQKFLSFFIFDLMKINKDVVFSYRKNVSTYDAIFPHINSKYIFTIDIEKFFLNIKIEKLKKLLIVNKDNYLIDSKDIDTYIETIRNLVTYEGILPIGAPTSPQISNAYLFELDNELQKYCETRNIIYTRYSDDFIFSSNELELFSDFEDILKNKFKELEFDEFNLKKKKIQKQGSKVIVLGLIITPQGDITVDKKIKEDIEILIYFYLNKKEKFKDFFSKKYSSSIDKVSGILSHIQSIDTKFISKLKRKYGSYIVNSLIHRDINE